MVLRPPATRLNRLENATQGGWWTPRNATTTWPSHLRVLTSTPAQVPGWTNSANIDMIAIYMTGLATILLLLVPFIPGLRDIPRLILGKSLKLADVDKSGVFTSISDPSDPLTRTT
jgi:hypothetical protein